VSHIVEIRTEVRDAEAVAAACRRLGLPQPVQGQAKLFSGEVSGLLVKLPGWVYPAVVHVESGTVEFDNYQGAWGSQEQLDKFLQAYAIEKTRIEARRKGHSVVEQALPDGSVKLTVTVGGGA
jgi:hypothetical protein